MIFTRCLIVLGLIGLTACSGLGGEPPIIATSIPPTATVTELGYPSTLPDMDLGAQIFAVRCVDCHGATGAGDGPLVANGQVQNAGNFTVAETASQQTPLQWYQTITNGRIENLMPPWRSALTEDQRWAVAHYTYTQHYSAEEIVAGEALWESVQSELGDATLPNFSDPMLMVNLSDQTLFNMLSQGEAMPSLAETLTDEERWAVAHYLRTLSLSKAPTGQTPLEPSATQELDLSETGSISGVITNGTAASTIPETLTVELLVFSSDLTQLLYEAETTSNAQGVFTFADVPRITDAAYLTSTTYRDHLYASAITQGSTFTSTVLDLPITIYELTEDDQVLEIVGVVSQVTVVGDSLEVAQVYNITNTSDRVYSTSQTVPDGRSISLIFTLPPGAIIAAFGDANRFVISEDQSTILDTRPVLPGEGHIVQVVYLIPYENSAIIEQEFHYNINGNARLLISPQTIRVTSEQLPSRGIETVGQTDFASYGGPLNLPAGSVIRYELAGTGFTVSPQGELIGETVPTNNLVLIIGGVIVIEIVLVVALYLFYARRRTQKRQPAANTPAPQQNTLLMDALVQQIAELDASYEAGTLEQADYQRRRDALKTRLAQLMDEQSS